MRGEVFDISVCHALFGITPAYAGRRQPQFIENGTEGDHPRVCGEK